MTASINFRVVRGVTDDSTGIVGITMNAEGQDNDRFVNNPADATITFSVDSAETQAATFKQGAIIRATFTEAT